MKSIIYITVYKLMLVNFDILIYVLRKDIVVIIVDTAA